MPRHRKLFSERLGVRVTFATVGGGVGAREVSIVQLAAAAKEWERLTAEGAAWADTVADVLRKLEISERAGKRAAATAFEQAQMGLL